MLGALAGLALSAPIKHDDSAVSALSTDPGDKGHTTDSDISLTYELSAGGSVHQIQQEVARVAAASNMRRQKLGAVPVVAVESGAQHRLANDLVNLLADPNNEEVKKACKEARAMLDARKLLARSPTVDTAILIARNISAETLAAEADPCKALEDKLGAPMEGHVIVITAQHGGGKVEVPISDLTAPSPLSEEEEKMQRALYIFVGSCVLLGVCMIGTFAATVYTMTHKKELAAKLAALAEKKGSVRKSKFKHSHLKEADEPSSDDAEGKRQTSEPISACEVASSVAESAPDPDF